MSTDVVANAMVVTYPGTVPAAVTPHLELLDANAVSVSAEVSYLTAGAKFELQVHASNDLDNWTDTGVAVSFTTVGAGRATATAIGMRYVRLAVIWKAAVTGTGIFAAQVSRKHV